MMFLTGGGDDDTGGMGRNLGNIGGVGVGSGFGREAFEGSSLLG